MSNILHLIDDQKITDDMICNFNSVGINHFFLVRKKDISIKYTHRIDQEKVELFENYEKDINSYVKQYNIAGVIIHGLNLRFASSIIDLDPKVRIGWVVWGFDIYDLPKIKIKLFSKSTLKYLLKYEWKFLLELLLKSKDSFRYIIYKLLLKRKDPLEITLNAIKRINHFITYFEQDYKVFNKYYPSGIDFFYSTFSHLEQYLGGNKNAKIRDDACDIVVGNSNTYENNHLDAFNLIAENISESSLPNIIVPLSYGGVEKYKTFVLSKGKEVFGTKFYPLISFMERSAYIDILSKCSVGFFYHYRQQAMGNIIAMIYMGSRIYLSKMNPAYHFFKENGLFVFEIESDFKVFRNTRLSNEEIEINRTKLEQIFDEDKVKLDLTNLSRFIVS